MKVATTRLVARSVPQDERACALRRARNPIGEKRTEFLWWECVTFAMLEGWRLYRSVGGAKLQTMLSSPLAEMMNLVDFYRLKTEGKLQTHLIQLC